MKENITFSKKKNKTKVYLEDLFFKKWIKLK